MQKVTLNLREGDFSRLQALHGRSGAGKVIRELVIGHISRIEKHVAKTVPANNTDHVLPAEDLKQ